ncbi:MAG TPA: winged helix-turn-helix domain-containing protein, partial [Blastocatellia bacterium]|nr:winged helix-turn-helix domain-containing protein [Blastocatellia bacterium]
MPTVTSKPTKQIYEFGPFRLDAAERLLLRDGRPVPLPPKVFDTLVVLVENSGRLVEKDELLAKLWPDTFVEEATIARNISDLRKALGEAPGGHKYIKTVPRHGYRFAAAVLRPQENAATLVIERHTRSHIVAEESEAGAQAEVEQAARSQAAGAAVSGNRLAGRKAFPTLAVAVAALAGLAAAFFYFQAMGEKEGGALTGVRTIAVLPFKPMTGQEGDEYLELGMADALITRLANVRQIIVRPTSAVLKYQKPGQDVAAAGRELGVDA